MFLAVDIGNTQTSIGLYNEEKLTHHWRLETNPVRAPEEYAAFLFPILSHFKLQLEAIKAVGICSVVPSAELYFTQFCEDYFHRKPLLIHQHLPLGLKLNVDIPSEVGADRLVNAAYAVRKLPLPAIVVDFGTATTFDVITASRSYEGGVILPGIRLGFESLSSRTAKLPLVGIDFPKSVIGKTTKECIQSGMMYGYASLIDGLVNQIEKELGGPATLALTGGLGYLFKNKLKKELTYLPNLTLDGIFLLHQETA